MKASISSMTGFARLDGAHKARRWTWELRSVNSRGLELRFRMPQGYDDLEPAVRKALQEKLSRGSVNVNLTLQSDSSEPRYRVNETALSDAMAAVEKIGTQINCDLPRPEGVLALRGVLEQADDQETEEERTALASQLLASLATAIDKLAAARASEGAAMGSVLAGQFDEIENLTAQASSMADATPEAMRVKVAGQIAELLAGANIPEERLAQEAALLAVKADIREELDRLRAHVVTGRDHLASTGPVGRQLDFLTQEFNREANTLCSKAQNMALKRVGLELKKVIDQMREQVQNIE